MKSENDKENYLFFIWLNAFFLRKKVNIKKIIVILPTNIKR